MFRLCILMGCFVWASALAQVAPVDGQAASSACLGRDALSQAIAAGDIARIGKIFLANIQIIQRKCIFATLFDRLIHYTP